MRTPLNLITIVLLVAAGGSLTFFAASDAATHSAPPDIVSQLIARERASYEAWQHKEKAFWNDYLTDEATYFGPDSPYLEVDPKVNFVPKFEQYAEVFKLLDFQLYNPHVQVHGPVAVLTYNLAQLSSVGGRMMSSTGKVSRVFVNEGGVWRVIHTHESVNPKAQ
jgi:ketosteroid isomerase-like protein